VPELSIGIDVGGTKVLGGVVDSQGNILTTHREETPQSGGSALTQTVIGVIQELLAQYPEKEIAAVGISAAGFVSSDRQTMLAAPNIAGWNGLNLRNEIMKENSLSIVIENDANAAAWGEAKYGAGRGEKDVMMLTIGTGIGGGLVNDGELYRGAFGVAGEFGHVRIVPNGIECGCGARGCFEQYASGSALKRHLREEIERSPEQAEKLLVRAGGKIENLKGDLIMAAARDGDALALGAFNTTGDWLGAGIASIAMVIDPACVVIGGGVAEAGEILMRPTRAAIEKYMPFNKKHPSPKVFAAQLGNDAGLVGVADLARR
jgi:glucokinase